MKNIRNYLERDFERILSYVVVLPFLFLSIQFIVLNVFNLYESPVRFYVQIATKVLTGLSFAVALPLVVKRSLFVSFVAYTVCVIIFLASYIIYPENRVFMRSEMFQIFAVNLPLMLYVQSISNKSVFIKSTYSVGKYIGCFMTILGLIRLWGELEGRTYSMSFSYYLLFPCLLEMRELFSKFCLKKFAFLLLMVILIVMKGSRGALACIAVFYFFMLFSKHTYFGNNKRENIEKKFVLFLLMTMLVIFNQQFFSVIGSVADALNINSRTASIMSKEILIDESKSEMLLLEKLSLSEPKESLVGNQKEDADNEEPSPESYNRSLEKTELSNGGIYLAGRGVLYRIVWNSIKESNYRGLGLLGDRLVLGGQYAHNVVLEFFSHFGVFIGGTIAFLYVLCLLYVWVKTDKNGAELISIWTALGIVPLMFSGSYLLHMHFWILNGIILMNGREIYYAKKRGYEKKSNN